MYKFLITTLCVFTGFLATAQHNPKVEIKPIDQSRVAEIISLLSDQPNGFGEPSNQRETWNLLKASGKYDKIIKEADKLLNLEFPAWDEDLFMGFFTRGDSQSGKDMQNNRLQWLIALVWAECLCNNNKYISDIEHVIKELIEQKTWVNPRNYREENFGGLVELSTAAYAHNLAQALYLLEHKLNPELKKEIVNALYTRVFNPILKTFETLNKDHNWLTETNNWNAVCLSGITASALTVIPNKKERAVFVYIAERYIRNFEAGFSDDGYCTEGLSYFNYGFSRYMVIREIVSQSTNGKIDLFSDNPKITKIAWFLPKMEIINDIYPAIADCRQYSKPSKSILQYLSHNFNMGLPDYDLKDATENLTEYVMNIFPKYNTTSQLTGNDTDFLRSYFDIAGVLTVRPTIINQRSMGANLKGGNNNEHHNHNDVGSFTIVVGDEILVGDPGSIPYTAKTFSSQRYEYKTHASYGHPVPLIAGQQQRTGAAAQAKVVKSDFSDEKDVWTLDLTLAYQVPELKKLTREFVFVRNDGESLQITDEYAFSSPETFETALITREKWKKVSDNKLIITGKSNQLEVTIQASEGEFTIKSEEISEANDTPYTRLGIELKKPAKEGKVIIIYKSN